MAEFDQPTQSVARVSNAMLNVAEASSPSTRNELGLEAPATATKKRSLQRLAHFAILLALLLNAGCKGCFDDKPDKPEDEKKVKENFEAQTPVTLPGFYPIDPVEKKKLEKEAKDDEKKRKLLQRMDPAIRFNRAKLGHWISVDFLAVSYTHLTLPTKRIV